MPEQDPSRFTVVTRVGLHRVEGLPGPAQSTSYLRKDQGYPRLRCSRSEAWTGGPPQTPPELGADVSRGALSDEFAEGFPVAENHGLPLAWTLSHRHQTHALLFGNNLSRDGS